MPSQKVKSIFHNHWEMKNLIDQALDIVDSAEDTSPLQFRLVFKGVVSGFIRARLGKFSSKDANIVLDALFTYAARPKRNPRNQARMARFLELVYSKGNRRPPTSDHDDEPLPVVMVRLTGLNEDNISKLLSGDDPTPRCRLYMSEANEGAGIVVFADSEAHAAFLSRFFKANPGMSDLLWDNF